MNTKNKTLCIIQGRMGSTRFPGKTLKEIAGKPLLHYVISRVSKAKRIDKVVVATSDQKEDDAIAEYCKKSGTPCFRGDLHDVLKRFGGVVREYSEFETIVRVTADCPLIDPAVIDKVLGVFEKTDADYVSNVLTETYPDGIDVEVFKKSALLESAKEAELSSEREHVTLYIRNNPKYKKVNVENDENLARFRLTVDDPEDLEVVNFLIENYGDNLGFKEYTDLLLKHREILAKNEKTERNAGLKKSLKEDSIKQS
jgi:spore coat polysaccharide biosynthesis protein SpsF